MFLVLEAELGAFFLNAKAAISIPKSLEELGHVQPPTPMQTDNLTVLGVINKKIHPKVMKAMDMRFHQLKGQETQGRFRFYWRPGPHNNVDYPSKGSHHRQMKPEFLKPVSHV